DVSKGIVAAPQWAHMIRCFPRIADRHFLSEDLVLCRVVELESGRWFISHLERQRPVTAVAHNEADEVIGAQAELGIVDSLDFELFDRSGGAPIRHEKGG